MKPFKIVSNLAFSPGTCTICGASGKEKYVDTLIDISTNKWSTQEHRLYLCDDCVDELSKSLGYARQADVKEQSMELEASLARTEEVIAENARLKDAASLMAEKLFQEILERAESKPEPKPKAKPGRPPAKREVTS